MRAVVDRLVCSLIYIGVAERLLIEPHDIRHRLADLRINSQIPPFWKLDYSPLVICIHHGCGQHIKQISRVYDIWREREAIISTNEKHYHDKIGTAILLPFAIFITRNFDSASYQCDAQERVCILAPQGSPGVSTYHTQISAALWHLLDKSEFFRSGKRLAFTQASIAGDWPILVMVKSISMCGRGKMMRGPAIFT